MKLFTIVASALAAVALAGNGKYSEDNYARAKSYAPGDYDYGTKGGYGDEYFQTSGYGSGEKEAYKMPVFEYPPVCERIKIHMEHCGEDLRAFFHHVHEKLHHLKERIKGFFKDLFGGLKLKFDCFAARLHIRFRKCKSDWERVAFWGHCKKEHFKHWCEYEKRLAEGKCRIYSKYQHDLVCALRKYKEEMKEEYSRRVKECAPVKEVYSQTDVEYAETVGYGEYKAGYDKIFHGHHEEHKHKEGYEHKEKKEYKHEEPKYEEKKEYKHEEPKYEEKKEYKHEEPKKY